MKFSQINNRSMRKTHRINENSQKVKYKSLTFTANDGDEYDLVLTYKSGPLQCIITANYDEGSLDINIGNYFDWIGTRALKDLNDFIKTFTNGDTFDPDSLWAYVIDDDKFVVE